MGKNRLICFARRRPFAALYALGALALALWLAGSFLLDCALFAAGVYKPMTITLADSGQYTLVNLEQTGPDTLVSATGDAQLLLAPGVPVRTLRLAAEYADAGQGGEKDLYYHLPGFGYTRHLRVWPSPTADGAGWVYTLPRLAGRGVRLDLADTAGVTVRIQAVVLNERPPWTSYLPGLWQLFWLAVLPGLAGCALTLRRGLPGDDTRRSPAQGE